MIEHNGKIYARVSDILKPYVNYEGVNIDVLNNKARIGTNVHQAINDVLKDEYPALEHDMVGYFDSYLGWKKEGYECILTEERFYCDKLMITGQIDALMKIGDSNCLVDFKTSYKANEVTWPMQAHFYFHLMLVNKIKFDDALFLKLHKYGREAEEYWYGFSEEVMGKCIDAVEHFWNVNRKDLQ